MALRDSWLRFGATFARILALPLFLVGATGWVPARMLDVPPKGPWPWGAIVGLSMIVGALIGLLLQRETSSEAQSAHTPRSPS